MSYHNFPRGLFASPRLKWEPWPAGLALALGVFVCFQVALVVFSARGFEGPDQVHAYRLGLEYTREVQRQTHQRRQGWRLQVLQQQPLRCQVLDRDGQPLPGELTLLWKRPATRLQDHQEAAQLQDKTFGVDWQPAPGQWLVEFDFRAQGQHFRQQRRWNY